MRIVALEEHLSFASFAAELDATQSRAARRLRRRRRRARRARRRRRAAAGLDGRLRHHAAGHVRSRDGCRHGVSARSRALVRAPLQRRSGGPRGASARIAFSAFAHLPLTHAGGGGRRTRTRGARTRLPRRDDQRAYRRQIPGRSVLRSGARARGSARRADLHPSGRSAARVRALYYDGFSPDGLVYVRNRRLGLARGDRGAHPAHGAGGDARQTPRLKLIIGHMGEGLPTMLDRCDGWLRTEGAAPQPLGRPNDPRSGRRSQPAASSPSRRFSPRCSPSGRTASCSRWTTRSAETRGARVPRRAARTPADREKIAHGNADRILKLTPA